MLHLPTRAGPVKAWEEDVEQNAKWMANTCPRGGSTSARVGVHGQGPGMHTNHQAMRMLPIHSNFDLGAMRAEILMHVLARFTKGSSSNLLGKWS